MTLGIYLMHPIFLDIIRYFNLDPMSFNPIISIPLITLFVFTMSVITSWFLSLFPYLRRVI
jgi:surface polysaccharide O-acyltransferase-like enzyme